MRTTKHARVQEQRRGISPDAVDLVLSYGEELKAHRHGRIVRLKKRDFLELQNEVPEILWKKYRDSLTRTVPLLGEAGDLVTVMHRFRRIRRVK
jgi:hypothetical protein